MRTHRFYTAIPLQENTSVELPQEAAHHCAQVLRYKVNDPLTIFNGDGFDYCATITQIEKKRCEVSISKRTNPENESPLKIHLIQGIARGDKMDFIIQKAIELGVTEITPLFTERCNVKLDKKRLDKKIQHWTKIIVSACEQSGRAFVPTLNTPLLINELTNQKNASIYLEPTSNESIKSLSTEQTITVMIGPEGGFSEKDLHQLEQIKCTGVKMGPRILRTETAGLAAISILQSCFGDI